MKRVLIFILILSIFLINFISAEMFFSDAGVEYQQSITERFSFNKSLKYVNVIVGIKDNSGITIEGEGEERNALIDQKENWGLNKVQQILNLLPEEDFNGSSGVWGFEGNITKRGFEMLLNNSDIEDILDITGIPLPVAQENGEGPLSENISNESTEIANITSSVEETTKINKKNNKFYIYIIGGLIVFIIVGIIIKKSLSNE